jgi:hypothetical protein
MTIRRVALCALVTIVVAGCSTGTTAATNPTMCADWRSMSETAQTELVTTIVDANDLLEAVRAVQHESRAVPNGTLMQDAVGSVSKSCQVIGRPDRLVADLVVQLYDEGRASDGYFGASGAPTPQRQSSRGPRIVPRRRAAGPGGAGRGGRRAASHKFPAKSSPGEPWACSHGLDDSALGRRQPPTTNSSRPGA